MIVFLLLFSVAVLAYYPDPTRKVYSPLIGGIQIYIEGTGYYCTIGYPAIRTIDNKKGIVTAGHCYNWDIGYSKKTYQPEYSNDYYIGTADTWAPIIDMAFIPTTDITPKTLHINSATGTSTQLSVSRYLTFGEVSQGMEVYKTGRSTGTTAGKVITKDDYDSSLNLRYGIWIEPMDALEGDSGAPVYIYKSTSAELVGYLVSDVGGLKVAISVSGPIEFADTYPLTG